MNKTQVMIVEDKAQVALDVQDCLEVLGYGITGIAGSGEEAVEMAETDKPDVVLMDIHLREKMDGIEAADHIYSRFGIPIIFLSAFTDEDLLDRAKKVGPFGYLVKPFRENELKATIEMTLQKSQLEKERDFANLELLKIRSSLESILNSVIPISVTDLDFNVIKVNDAYLKIFNEDTWPMSKCYDSRRGSDCHSDQCPIQLMRAKSGEYSYERVKETSQGEKIFLVNSRPYFDAKGKTVGIVETFQDITARKEEEEKREELIVKLQKAQEEIQTLRGIIPICMHCKEIRDEQGYWNRLEKYISEHSEAKFSHSICDSCFEKHYGHLK